MCAVKLAAARCYSASCGVKVVLLVSIQILVFLGQHVCRQFVIRAAFMLKI